MKKNRFSLSKIFYNDRFVMLFSVVAALALWIFISVNSPESRREYSISNIPIEIELSDSAKEAGLEVFDGKETTGTVRIRGNVLVAGLVGADDIKISAKTAAVATPGTYTLELNYEKVGTLDFDIVSQSPQLVSVYVDRLRERTFTIDDSGVERTIDSEHYAGSVDLSQKEITVSGPETVMDTVDRVVAECVFEGELTATQTQTASLVLYDKYGEIIQNEHLVMSAKEVEATVPVYLRREVELEPDFAGKPSGFDMSRVSIDPASLEIAATDDVFQSFDTIKLEQLDFSRINTRYRSFDNLEILIPTGCKNLSNAYKASLSIDMSGMTYQTFTVTQFEVLNLSSDKEASVSTQSLNVEINGPAGEIANLTEEDIVAVIDMRGRESFTGHTEVPVTIRIKNAPGCWAYYVVEPTANISVSLKEETE